MLFQQELADARCLARKQQERYSLLVQPPTLPLGQQEE
jgi:hypothetical protein